MSGLLPCPFCGHEPVRRQIPNDGAWEIACQTVTCIRPKFGPAHIYPKERAITAWNTRAQPDAVAKLVDALKTISAMCPATCDMSVAHQMADVADDALAELTGEGR